MLNFVTHATLKIEKECLAVYQVSKLIEEEEHIMFKSMRCTDIWPT